MEAIILTEIGMPTIKTVMQNQRDNDEELIKQLDWVDEMQGYAAIRMTSYYQRAIAQYNKRADHGFLARISSSQKNI